MGCEQGAERCELCGAPAAVHCAADAAFLCAACDAKVHGANFLASRHRRTRLVLAAGVHDDEEEEGYESSATSSCVSTSDSASRPPRGRRRAPPLPGARRPRAEAVLEGWAKRIGVPTRAARRRAAARAVPAFGSDVVVAAASARVRVPPRVATAAALWWEVAAGDGCGGAGTGQGDALRRLEACAAHVPARLVVAVGSSVARARARRRAGVDAIEGCDEC